MITRPCRLDRTVDSTFLIVLLLHHFCPVSTAPKLRGLVFSSRDDPFYVLSYSRHLFFLEKS